jgi:hypothetical protein
LSGVGFLDNGVASAAIEAGVGKVFVGLLVPSVALLGKMGAPVVRSPGSRNETGNGYDSE